MTAPLALVASRPDPTGAPETSIAEDLLRDLVPGLIEAEAAVARYRQLIAEQGRILAKERRVAFIREEALRKEFGRG